MFSCASNNRGPMAARLAKFDAAIKSLDGAALAVDGDTKWTAAPLWTLNVAASTATTVPFACALDVAAPPVVASQFDEISAISCELTMPSKFTSPVGPAVNQFDDTSAMS